MDAFSLLGCEEHVGGETALGLVGICRVVGVRRTDSRDHESN